MAGELIGKDALERIIQRAAELQTGERDIGDGLSEEELLALGKDVGIPSRYLKQALLEERTRLVDESQGDVWSFAGPARLSAQRVVPGDRGAVERALSQWMEDQELLQVKRRQPDRTSWEPQVGFFASMQRGFKTGGRSYALARAVEVAGQVTPLESGFCHVRLAADVRNLRQARIGSAAGLLSAGAVGTAVSITLGVMLPVALLPAALFTTGAIPVLTGHRGQNEKIQVALEQVLDRLERGEIRPEHALPGPRASAFVRIADEIRKQFQ
ncbi:MAG: hypothetical protein ACREMF_03040 [Gemmatimonadales bacterium]